MTLATPPAPVATSAPAAAPSSTPAPAGTQSDPPEPKSGYVAEPLHDIPEAVDKLLVTILSWPRKHGSFQELQFCKWLREYIDGLGVKREIMGMGNLVATVPRLPTNKLVEGKIEAVLDESTTLFSCHIDTIEGYDGPAVGDKWVSESKDKDGVVIPAHWEKADDTVDAKMLRKKLTYDPHFGVIALDKGSIGGSLGADDGAGVWLMLKMMEAGVPGTYVFHRGEEVGGLGSKDLAEKKADFLGKFEAAVAFDRHRTYEIITHQGGQKCASDKFAEALCKRLNEKSMSYKPSTGGVFTDTKNYRKLIAECINIGVGYESQHGRNETLDYPHLNALLDACCAIDWDSLPIDRDPKASDYQGYSGGGYGGGYGRGFGRRGYDDLTDDENELDWVFPRGKQADTGGGKGKNKKKKPQQQQQTGNKGAQPDLFTVSDELANCSLKEIEEWCFMKPGDAATAIGQLLIEINNLKATTATTMMLLGWKDD